MFDKMLPSPVVPAQSRPTASYNNQRIAAISRAASKLRRTQGNTSASPKLGLQDTPGMRWEHLQCMRYHAASRIRESSELHRHLSLRQILIHSTQISRTRHLMSHSWKASISCENRPHAWHQRTRRGDGPASDIDNDTESRDQQNLNVCKIVWRSIVLISGPKHLSCTRTPALRVCVVYHRQRPANTTTVRGTRTRAAGTTPHRRPLLTSPCPCTPTPFPQLQDQQYENIPRNIQ